MLLTETVGTFTILSGATTSEKLSAILSKGQAKDLTGGMRNLTIFAPATLTGTVTVKIAPTEAATTFNTLTKDGTDVTVAAGKTATVTTGAFKDLQLVSGSAEGADRVFTIVAQIETF
ncbi:hypothetical protein UFOVP1537_51 [uncultured Caudovirales phage]|uniref:Uncharacterized protein n=2 Tax=root TaxID=1 RepID=A0A6J5PJN3_9CAUD|nr:hypothetical protein UFOVP825_16 [uncultured Caudovirales phage]CAB4171347.1 hypothetical protein UFOVP915_51 [uncultured Caudovirales phage]CAB4177198.1 hypothetical protein UFOVP1000_15 [uncultured Caudovirales phage]CAB4183216.1 hypothetical protein UFOVP1092_43 [uncultured Caudovirales phage]CAB4187695.1 hypothetical protein UFOVP1152_47 [uncultured Caudovirales phage]